MNPCTGGGPVGLPVEIGRTDVRPSGNRVAPGSIDLLAASRTTVELPGKPVWVVRHPGPDGPCEPSWYVAMEDGTSVIVSAGGNVSASGPAVVPPETDVGQEVLDARRSLTMFQNPLPDSRVVEIGPWRAALVDPTDRYGHGVLGDRIEAGGFEVVNTDTGVRQRITVDPPAVIEGISPMLLDLDLEGSTPPSILVTVSDDATGARLVLYDIDGRVRAESDPIGRGNRWRNQLGGAYLGPDGEYEIVDIRTPHLDGVVEYFRIVDVRLELVASTSGYTTHSLGSRNLDLGLIVDADNDKQLEVVVPTRNLKALVVLERTADGVEERGRVELASTLTSNVATQWINGQAWLATGTSNNTLIIFGDATRP